MGLRGADVRTLRCPRFEGRAGQDFESGDPLLAGLEMLEADLELLLAGFEPTAQAVELVVQRLNLGLERLQGVDDGGVAGEVREG
jgi:hypothetical protein